MNILFLTIGRFESIEAHSIYPDLLREFRNHGHGIYIMCAQEKRYGISTGCLEECGATILRTRIGNITKCGMIEKGISTLKIENQYKKTIDTYFSDVKFDLILYSTPPITLCGVVEYVKKRDGAKTYLLLKDIFPQNAVDLGIINKKGFKGLIYKYFRRKEKKLYAISDQIGCMSQANVNYILKNNQEIKANKVHVSPNCIEPIDISLTKAEIISMRNKYNIPIDKKIFVYGGNLGKPQGIPFLIDCIRTQKCNSEVFFLIVGDGTEFAKLDKFVKEEKPKNVCLLRRMPKEDYDRMVAACDVGMLFLDYRFTIPNFPSRLLSYMQAGIPVLACTDLNTDVGQVIEDGQIGWWCGSNDIDKFAQLISIIVKKDLKQMKFQVRNYLNTHFNVAHVYRNIINTLNDNI